MCVIRILNHLEISFSRGHETRYIGQILVLCNACDIDINVVSRTYVLKYLLDQLFENSSAEL